jgi:hypothetical protein
VEYPNSKGVEMKFILLFVSFIFLLGCNSLSKSHLENRGLSSANDMYGAYKAVPLLAQEILKVKIVSFDPHDTREGLFGTASKYELSVIDHTPGSEKYGSNIVSFEKNGSLIDMPSVVEMHIPLQSLKESLISRNEIYCKKYANSAGSCDGPHGNLLGSCTHFTATLKKQTLSGRSHHGPVAQICYQPKTDKFHRLMLPDESSPRRMTLGEPGVTASMVLEIIAE